MEVIDSKKLETALIYIDRIANGNNPISNMPAGDDAVLNNPNVIRCMFFVKEVLKEVQRNGGMVGAKPKKREKEEFPYGVVKEYRYQNDTSITKIVEGLNQLIDTEVYKKIGIKTIVQWLILNEYLCEVSDEAGKIIKKPTVKGEALGIREENREFNGRKYIAVIYNRQAQEFIVHNLEKIINGEV